VSSTRRLRASESLSNAFALSGVGMEAIISAEGGEERMVNLQSPVGPTLKRRLGTCALRKAPGLQLYKPPRICAPWLEGA
jgi:hypothetical protein